MRFFLRVTTVLLFLTGTIWLIVEPGFEPLTAFLTGILTLFGSFVVDKSETSESLNQRNRRILLGHVENFWIKGVLEKSLYGATLLELGIREVPNSVESYIGDTKKESSDDRITVGTSMLEVFDEIGMGRSLLILGAPGSGKTTMLLELARQLIEHARRDPTEPIPIVFNLASWTEKLKFPDWLAQELNAIYNVPLKTALNWVKGNKLFLLLDGLDEVRRESRDKCLEEINTFKKEFGLTSLVVCSRSNDYSDTNKKLFFEGAIEIQPLTQEQIAEFLNRFGDNVAGLRQILEKDNVLHEMAKTPLFLSIMIIAYQDKKDVDIPISQNQTTHVKQLLDIYVERMLERRLPKDNESSIKYEKQDVLKWLSWLAGKMLKHNQDSFLLERLQFYWLGENKQVRVYKFFYRLWIGLAIVLCCGAIIAMANKYELTKSFHMGLALALLFFGIFASLRITDDIKTIDSLRLDWITTITTFLYYSTIPVFFFFTVYLVSSVLYDISFLGTYFYDVPPGRSVYDFVTFIRNHGEDIANALDNMTDDQMSIWKMELEKSREIFRNSWIADTPVFFFASLSVGLISSLDRLSVKQINHTTYPAQKIVLSGKHSLFILISGWLIFIFFSAVLFLLINIYSDQIIEIDVNTLERSLFFSLYTSLVIWFIVTIFFGGDILIKHYILRFFTARNNFLPWNLVPFLDHCVDLIFLQRVGGGYIFIHRLLMEHFAEMRKEIKID